MHMTPRLRVDDMLRPRTLVSCDHSSKNTRRLTHKTFGCVLLLGLYAYVPSALLDRRKERNGASCILELTRAPPALCPNSRVQDMK